MVVNKAIAITKYINSLNENSQHDIGLLLIKYLDHAFGDGLLHMHEDMMAGAVFAILCRYNIKIKQENCYKIVKILIGDKDGFEF